MSVSPVHFASTPVSHTVATTDCETVLVCEHAVDGDEIYHVRYRCLSCGAVGVEQVGPRSDFGAIMNGRGGFGAARAGGPASARPGARRRQPAARPLRLVLSDECELVSVRQVRAP